MQVKRILVSQPTPAVFEKSPFYDLAKKHNIEIDFRPFIKVVGVSLKEFRAQRVEILPHTAVIFSARTTVDCFFNICAEARITVPETMKYICQTEAVALYLQKYIVYRKRKIFFADGTVPSLIDLIVKNKGENFLLGLTEPHRPELPEALTKLHIAFDPVIFARTVMAEVENVDLSVYELLALYSPSCITTLVEKFGTENLPAIAVCGEATLRQAIASGLTVLANTPTPEAPSMAKAIEIYFDKLRRKQPIEPVQLPPETPIAEEPAPTGKRKRRATAKTTDKSDDKAKKAAPKAATVKSAAKAVAKPRSAVKKAKK